MGDIIDLRTKRVTPGKLRRVTIEVEYPSDKGMIEFTIARPSGHTENEAERFVLDLLPSMAFILRQRQGLKGFLPVQKKPWWSRLFS